MSLTNPIDWLRRFYPRVRAAIAQVGYWCDQAERHFPKAANGIKRGREKLEYVRLNLERAYNALDGFGPAFDLVWPILAAAIERYLAKRAK